MKPIKMLGLAALAALMAMAFVGASSAMASSTQLCSTDPATSCTAVTHVHETTLAGHKAVLKTSSTTVECDVLFLSTTGGVGALGAPQVIKGNFTYSNCGGCTVTEENGPVEIKVLKTATETGTVTGEGLVKVVCSGFFTCSYNGEGLSGAAKGPLASTETNGEVKLVEQLTQEEGEKFFCPDEAKLTITTTPLAATYIGS